MTKHDNQLSKAEVQTTPLNKMPDPEDEVEFSAEEAAEVFERNETEDTEHADHQNERM